MPKPAKKPSTATTARATSQSPRLDHWRAQEKKADPGSKQARVIAMLQSSAGTTIAAMMKATGWQQHSVRGFLAGVVRKKLKLKLNSKKVDGNRVYRIEGETVTRQARRQSKRRAA